MNRNAAGDEIYIGLMSGTSLDGVDIAIVDFSGQQTNLIYSNTKPYQAELRSRIRDITLASKVSLDQLYTLDNDLGKHYSEIVNQALADEAIDRSRITAIGCHGQTIRHRPDIASAYTAQIGDPNQLAARTGITTIADFRRKDMAFGGQGAPLACAFHKAAFQTASEDRAVINIGGISNITLLPSDSACPVTGFDTGPGNTLFDHWCSLHLGKPYDQGGEWARSGQIIPSMLDDMLNGEAYFNRSLPKSTGTEHFNPEWMNRFLSGKHATQDVQATLVELTALTITDAFRKQARIPSSCFVCGGGAHNQFLMERLENALPGSRWHSTEKLGVDPDYVEAIAFAWLARERLNQRSGNLPEVTCARSHAVLGGCYDAG